MEPDELERAIFFERAKDEAEAAHEKNPNDAAALTRWGGALLELAHFRQGHDAFDMIEQAVEKFVSALKIDPKRPETLWCLGNAYTSQGFLTTDSDQAKEYFDQAGDAFSKASKEDSENETYKKALEMIQKAPDLHDQLQKQLQSQQDIPMGGRVVGERPTTSASDFWYDVAGWGILLGIGIAWVSLARTDQVVAPAK